MSKQKRVLSLVFIVALLLMAGLPLLSLRAQSDPTMLSLAIPEYMSSQLDEDLFAQFETDHPGVKIKIVKTGEETYYPPAAYELDKHFEGAEKYVGAGDVLFTSSYNLSVEATRAGYFLDLSPIMKGDAAFNADDFVPAALQSFQWDGGTWGLPVTFDLMFLGYDPKAFDKAGVPYPDGNWTIDEFADAIRKLTIKDSDGEVTVPGIQAWNLGLMFRSLSGENFQDNTTSPSTPKFDKPAIENLLTIWAELNEEKVTGGDFRGDYNAIPMRLDQSYSLAENTGNAENVRKGALLPGGYAGITVQGFAISAGTQHPELAYELLKFLSSDPTVSSRFFGSKPALKNVAPVNDEDTFTFKPKYSEENQAFLDMAMEKMLPASEYLFSDYINKALSDMSEKKQDAKTALQAAQETAITALQTAETKRGKTVVAVATIAPTPVLAANEVSLKFNLNAYISPLPNKDEWEKTIKEFVDTDPLVGNIELDSGFVNSMEDMGKKFDCWTMPYNMVRNNSDISILLNVDPLMSVDSSVDKSDFIGDSLAQFQQNSKLYGIPLYIQPQVLRYNSDLFSKAGLAAPANNWTIDEFNDALKALKPDAKADAPFVPREFGGNYMLLLIAAYGGLPIDPRTDPVTVKYTDPTNVAAIQQVLDLAKNGYIKYQKLANNGGGFGGSFPEDAIYTSALNMLSFRQFASPEDTKPDPYKVVGYPRGTTYMPVAFEVGGGYISSTTPNPEACYRWISHLSQHPELFSAMPARRSLLNSEGVTAQGEDVAAFYKDVDAMLQDPAALVLSSSFSSIGGYIMQFVLLRAFDRYVLESADLETELKEAQTFADTYQACIKDIPPPTSGQTMKEMQAYYKQFTDCATKTDPSLKSVFGME